MISGARAPTQSHAIYQAPSTKEMGELLVKIFREQDAKTDPSKDPERARDLQMKLVGAAESLLRAGDSAGAVQQIELIRKRCDELSIRLDPYSEQHLRDTWRLRFCAWASRRIAYNITRRIRAS